MGDDLGDEWRAQSEHLGDSGAEDIHNAHVSQATAEEPKEKVAEKRKRQTQEAAKGKKKKKEQKKSVVVKKELQPEAQKEATKPKKRRRTTITDVLATSEPAPGTPAVLRSLLQSHFSGTQSVIEQEALQLPVSCFLMSNDLTHSLSSYLKLTTFKGEAKVLKLFAKHIKAKEQMKLLSKSVDHIGVGTPGRLSTLIEKEGLSLQELRYLVLDWNYRDQKQKRMVDIPEVKAEFLKLMETAIIKKCQEGAVKIALF